MGHHTRTQGLAVLGDLSVGNYSQLDEPEQVKEERNILLKEVNSYKLEKERDARTLIHKEVARKAMLWFLVDFERTVNCPEPEKTFLRKTIEEHISSSSQTTTSGGQITDKFLKHIPSFFLAFAFNVEKEIL